MKQTATAAAPQPIQPKNQPNMTRSELYRLNNGAILEAVADGENYKTGDRARLVVEDNYNFRSLRLYVGEKFIGFLTRHKWRVVENPQPFKQDLNNKRVALQRKYAA